MAFTFTFTFTFAFSRKRAPLRKKNHILSEYLAVSILIRQFFNSMFYALWNLALYQCSIIYILEIYRLYGVWSQNQAETHNRSFVPNPLGLEFSFQMQITHCLSVFLTWKILKILNDIAKCTLRTSIPYITHMYNIWNSISYTKQTRHKVLITDLIEYLICIYDGGSGSLHVYINK